MRGKQEKKEEEKPLGESGMLCKLGLLLDRVLSAPLHHPSYLKNTRASASALI